jgi:hypothetical protein
MSTLDQYREAKNSYLKLKSQAKKELLARFHELSSELLQVQRELLEDFGEKVVIPTKPKKGAKPAPAKKAAAAPEPAAPAVPDSPKLAGWKKQLETQKKKLADAQAAGKPTQTIEDRIYELEDSIRLASA